MEKTEAESVDDIVAASKRAVVRLTPSEGYNSPKIHHVATPVMPAVSNTPMVANNKPCDNTGRISDILVSIPPENNIIHNATVPTDVANVAL